jgi:hypothetical protein
MWFRTEQATKLSEKLRENNNRIADTEALVHFEKVFLVSALNF